jgi:hypothetical protein
MFLDLPVQQNSGTVVPAGVGPDFLLNKSFPLVPQLFVNPANHNEAIVSPNLCTIAAIELFPAFLLRPSFPLCVSNALTCIGAHLPFTLDHLSCGLNLPPQNVPLSRVDKLRRDEEDGEDTAEGLHA